MEEAEELRKQFQKMILEDGEKKAKMKYEAKNRKQPKKGKQNGSKDGSRLKIVSMEDRMNQ